MLWVLVGEADIDAAFLRAVFGHLEGQLEAQHSAGVRILLMADLHYRLQHPWDADPPRLPPRVSALAGVVMRQVGPTRPEGDPCPASCSLVGDPRPHAAPSMPAGRCL